jgi:hypothetical protein
MARADYPAARFRRSLKTVLARGGLNVTVPTVEGPVVVDHPTARRWVVAALSSAAREGVLSEADAVIWSRAACLDGVHTVLSRSAEQLHPARTDGTAAASSPPSLRRAVRRADAALDGWLSVTPAPAAAGPVLAVWSKTLITSGAGSGGDRWPCMVSLRQSMLTEQAGSLFRGLQQSEDVLAATPGRTFPACTVSHLRSVIVDGTAVPWSLCRRCEGAVPHLARAAVRGLGLLAAQMSQAAAPGCDARAPRGTGDGTRKAAVPGTDPEAELATLTTAWEAADLTTLRERIPRLRCRQHQLDTAQLMRFGYLTSSYLRLTHHPDAAAYIAGVLRWSDDQAARQHPEIRAHLESELLVVQARRGDADQILRGAAALVQRATRADLSPWMVAHQHVVATSLTLAQTGKDPGRQARYAERQLEAALELNQDPRKSPWLTTEEALLRCLSARARHRPPPESTADSLACAAADLGRTVDQDPFCGTGIEWITNQVSLLGTSARIRIVLNDPVGLAQLFEDFAALLAQPDPIVRRELADIMAMVRWRSRRSRAWSRIRPSLPDVVGRRRLGSSRSWLDPRGW